MRFDLSSYATVEERLEKFWHDHPDGAIHTEIAHREGNAVIFKASVFFERGGELVATGFAEEIRDASPVNKTSFVENAETSAIGRALANCNYQMKKRASRQEMEKVQRQTEQPVATASGEQLMSTAQRKTLGDLVKALELNKKFTPYAETLLGRKLNSVDELTKKEATMLIARMIEERNKKEGDNK
jgi:hypothetical protein